MRREGRDGGATYAVHPLTGRAVAVFGGERFVAAQLVLYTAAVAVAFPFDGEVGGVIMDAVGRPVFPLVFGTGG